MSTARAGANDKESEQSMDTKRGARCSSNTESSPGDGELESWIWELMRTLPVRKGTSGTIIGGPSGLESN